MLHRDILLDKLASLDGKDYGAYQDLLGTYDFSDYKLIIHQIPKDPYAPPHAGIYRIQVRRDDARVLNLKTRSRIQEVALRDFLARRFYDAGSKTSTAGRGTGYSGIITIDPPGQCILERSSVVLDDDHIEVRCFLGLPARGRNINAAVGKTMLLEELPRIVAASLFQNGRAMEMLHRHVATAEDAQWLRNQLASRGVVAFIANDAVLPRESGISDRPMKGDTVTCFHAPDRLQVEFDLPHAGPVKGMGIPRGVTLITGGGYHGKSTLLNAIQAGIYNHIPGDGREKCVSLGPTVKVRSYSGRSIEKTDISSFIRDLPFQKNTTAFSTQNASGSTSQAAGIIEAIEGGAKVLLMDEDTCATNFMIRDSKMQQLVHKDDEPITAFIDRVRQLYWERDISTVIALGGSGDYFEVADRVIQMRRYQAVDVTAKARDIAGTALQQRTREGEDHPCSVRNRIPLAESINSFNEYGKKRIHALEMHRLKYGKSMIDLTDLEQLVELSQTKALGYALDYARRYMNGKNTLQEITVRVVKDIETHGLDVLSDRISGSLALFRDLDLAHAINRLRGVKMVQAS